jgi:hypothetical protein
LFARARTESSQRAKREPSEIIEDYAKDTIGWVPARNLRFTMEPSGEIAGRGFHTETVF